MIVLASKLEHSRTPWERNNLMKLSWDESTINLSPKGVDFTVPLTKVPEIGSLADGFLNKKWSWGWCEVNKIKNFAYTYISTNSSPLENEIRQKGKIFWHMEHIHSHKRLAFPSITWPLHLASQRESNRTCHFLPKHGGIWPWDFIVSNLGLHYILVRGHSLEITMGSNLISLKVSLIHTSLRAGSHRVPSPKYHLC